ncbi:hypothetical protein EW146_g7106 [Bondarzewia mesenterica]|uniref:C2H2-type domain-containing protein n=1 Tax=Bondarzewia mesenterica TaxID=1095465 RepID=A0A4S4LMG1_9AGAM|nr:hypothetical protein EW146_g7106 [Bondarzewia mesenterica]
MSTPYKRASGPLPTEPTSQRINSHPLFPSPRLYYEIPTPVDGAFGALTGDSNHQSILLSTSPSRFVFTTPIIHDPIRPAVSHPSTEFSQTPASQSTKKRKRTEDEDAQQLEQPVHYVWIVWEPPMARTTKRRATVHKHRVNETLRTNNEITRNRTSKDSVLAHRQAPDAVSSQTAGPRSSPNTADDEDNSEDESNDEVAEMSPSARAHEETQRMAVAALRREASGKYRCEMPGCDKLLSSPRETRRHIKKTKLHRHPDCKGEYACGHCGRRFGREDSMRRHLKNQICLKKMVSVAMDG